MQIKNAVSSAFDVELETRYNQAVKHAAENFVALQENMELHSLEEIDEYFEDAVETLALAFHKSFVDVYIDFRACVREIK